MKKRIEILAPAGSIESLEAAVCAGADAVYIGGSLFGARAYADNPEEESLLRAIDYVHLHGRKIYLTVNTLLKEEELEGLFSYLLPYYRQGLDAVIVQDVGVMTYIKRNFPRLPIHVSTQAAVTNVRGARFFEKLGADRIIPARELSFAEIKDIKEKTKLEVECFVHGSMCYCYSGQCLLSSMIGGRSGNRGQCAQPCRLPYSLGGRKPQELLSLKDLCTIDEIPALLDAGIDSFKIEGRMKQPDYVYTVTAMYRKYTDLCLKQGKERFLVADADRRSLEEAYTRRGYSDGYYNRQNGREMISLTDEVRPSRRDNIPCRTKSAHPKEIGITGGSVDRHYGTPYGNNGYKIKEKINGNLILSAGKRATLSVEYQGSNGTVREEAQGNPVQVARSAPLDKERAERQIRKTGTTDFVFDKVHVTLEGDLFLPMQSLNELRRDAIRKLEERILAGFKRDDLKESGRDAPYMLPCDKGKNPVSLKPKLSVLVQEPFQLFEVIKETALSVIYADGAMAFKEEVLAALEQARREKRIKIYAAMPYIFRERSVKWYETVYETLLEHYDGVLVRNWESYMWLKDRNYTKGMVSDYNLYVFNRESRDFMREQGFEDYTLPVELNARELKSLGGGGSLIIYGYQPVMVSANCVRKTVGSCKREEGLLWLTDRRQKKFAVKNHCSVCYNVMYNCTPLVLTDMEKETEELCLSGVRLDFTIESREEVREILRLYRSAFMRQEKTALPLKDYTRGHFKRGVK